MAQVQTKSLRKRSTGLRRAARGKRKRDLAGTWSKTTVGEKTRKRTYSTLGGGKKVALLSTDEIVVSNDGKSEKTKVLTVMENPANPHFVRRNIITKGAIVKTEKGFVKVTSSPGQSGVLNGIILKDYKPKVKKKVRKKEAENKEAKEPKSSKKDKEKK